MLKLLDYRERWEELEASDNPFAWVVMAHLKAMETQQSVEDRYHWKWELAQLLHRKGYGEEASMALYQFLDWVMALPEEVSKRFDAELFSWEEEQGGMSYVTGIEQRGIEKGIEQGKSKGQQETLLRQLRVKFSELPEAVVERIGHLDKSALDAMTERILQATTLTELGLGDDQTTKH